MRLPRPIVPISTVIATLGAVPFAHATSGESTPFLLDTRNYDESTPPFPVDTRAPDVIANTGITEFGGTSFTITMEMLQVTGGGTITFTLVTGPVHGMLFLDGIAPGAGATFTQAQIDAGLLSYQRGAGYPLTDTFEVAAMDDDAGLLGENLIFAVAGVPGASGSLFLVDTRNHTDSTDHTVHTDKRVYVEADGIPGSLRQAIANSPAGEKVDFDGGLSGGTITLGGSQLVMERDLEIDASALAGGITVSANILSRHFKITPAATVILSGLSLIDGFVDDKGGSILNSGNLTLKHSTLAYNTASGNGGVIESPLGSITMIDSCAFHDNHGKDGGAIAHAGSVTVVNSTIVNNIATGYGGGIFNFDSNLAVENATVTGNHASFGGGIGVYNAGAPASLQLDNSIVAANTATSIGNNLFGALPGTGNLIDQAPRLAPLGDYGGPTETMPPLPGSPAIEGAVLLGSTPATDQRGNPRPGGPRPDIGAVEAESLLLGMLADSDNDGIPDVMEGPGGPYPHLTVGVDDRGVDTDGDGSTDAEEIANMTDPNDAGDYFRVLNFALAAGFDPLTNPLVSITISSFPGLDYEAETDNALGTFEPVTGSLLTADDFTETVEVLLEPGTKSFGRIGRR